MLVEQGKKNTYCTKSKNKTSLLLWSSYGGLHFTTLILEVLPVSHLVALQVAYFSCVFTEP